MSNFVTGETIRRLREKRGCTQRQLAEQLALSDKTISKWETGKGLPDITLLAPLAKSLGVSLAELLSGEYVRNGNRSANLLRGHFYVCPLCGNVLFAAGEGAFSCCGITLPPLLTEEPEEGHTIEAEKMDGEYHVFLRHPMTREHHITFLALLTTDRLQLVKCYPEQEAETRFAMAGQGMLYAGCNRHGLFGRKL